MNRLDASDRNNTVPTGHSVGRGDSEGTTLLLPSLKSPRVPASGYTTECSSFSENSGSESTIKASRRPSMQRTSSVDFRRDYTTDTVKDLLGLLDFPKEWLVTVEHSEMWSRHMCWAKRNGKDLRDHKTQRYSSSTVFMSLLLNTELNMFFGSAVVNTNMRLALEHQQFFTLGFWAGLVLLCSIITTLLGLIATLTAWTMHSAVSPANAHCVFRSSTGLYVSSLPDRIIVASMYLFLTWLMLFFFLLVPFGPLSVLILVGTVALFANVITAFSAFGRLILHSGAMGPEPIFDENFESLLLPHSLQHNLITKAKANQDSEVSIKRQYSKPQRPLDRTCTLEEMTAFLASDPAMEKCRAAGGAKKDYWKRLYVGIREKKYGHRNNPSEVEVDCRSPMSSVTSADGLADLNV